MLNFYDFIQVFVFTTNHHHNYWVKPSNISIYLRMARGISRYCLSLPVEHAYRNRQQATCFDDNVIPILLTFLRTSSLNRGNAMFNTQFKNDVRKLICLDKI